MVDLNDLKALRKDYLKKVEHLKTLINKTTSDHLQGLHKGHIDAYELVIEDLTFLINWSEKEDLKEAGSAKGITVKVRVSKPSTQNVHVPIKRDQEPDDDFVEIEKYGIGTIFVPVYIMEN